MQAIQYPATSIVTQAQLRAARAAAKREKALAAIARNTEGTRNVNAAEYGLSGRWAKVTVLASSSRGRNARGTAGHKRGWGGSAPKGAKRAKRQGVERMGNSPRIARTNPYPV
jgi:hypothetical protein